jgi:hypothetical protein
MNRTVHREPAGTSFGTNLGRPMADQLHRIYAHARRHEPSSH